MIQVNDGQAESDNCRDNCTELQEVGSGVDTSPQYTEAVFSLMGIDKEADMYVRKRTCLAWRLRHVYIFNAVRTDSVECSVTGEICWPAVFGLLKLEECLSF